MMPRVFADFAATVVFVVSARAETYKAYLHGLQEVPTVSTSARGYARVFLNEQAGTISFTVVFSGLSSNQTAAHIHSPGVIGTNAPVAIDLGVLGGTSGTLSGTRNITGAQIAQLRSKQAYVNVHSANFPGGEIRGQLSAPRLVDYDGDGREDLSVLRFPNASPPAVAQITYWNLNSTEPVGITNWGDANTDFPVPGDYDGDGKTDVAVYRGNAAQSHIYILRSATGSVEIVPFGVLGDIAVPRDYDGDGRTDPAVFRRGAAMGAQSHFWIRRSTTSTNLVVPWGTTGDGFSSGDVPAPADYDGDGKADLAVYRFGAAFNPTNTYFILRSLDQQAQFRQWGDFSTDYVLPGDYDGDGKADFAAGRTGSSGSAPMVWWIYLSSSGATRVQTFGLSSDLPAQGDYNGDGRTDLAVYHRGATSSAQSHYWIHESLTNTPRVVPWGLGGDFSVNIVDSR